MKAVQLLIFVGMLHVAATIGHGLSNAPAVELISNWKVLFNILDVNDDFLLNQKDADDSRSRYEAMTNDRGELEPELADKLDEWWNLYVFDISPEMTETQFITSLIALYNPGKDELANFLQTAFSSLFEIHDTNNDGYISLEEFKVIHSVFGLHTMASDVGAFLEFEPEALGIPETRFVETWASLIIGANDIWTGVLKDRIMTDGLE